jgi:uncharacterized iron-regulated membrane protein
LILGAWFALIGVTGSLLAWRGELSAAELRWRFPREEQPVSAAQPIPLSQAVAAMQRAHPRSTARELATVTVPNARMPFYAFTRGRDRASQETILIDPYSARVHPPVRLRTLFVGTVNQLHARLLAGPRGYLANGALTALAAPLLLSGLWLRWPAKVRLLKARLMMKRGVPLQRTLMDLHNVMGIYLYPALLITTLTGMVLVAHHIDERGIQAYWSGQLDAPAGGRRNGGPGGERDAARMPAVAAQGQRLSDDELVARARTAMPGYALTRVRRPLRPDQPFQAASPWTRTPVAFWKHRPRKARRARMRSSGPPVSCIWESSGASSRRWSTRSRA